ncbi:MAG: DUF2922 domain-containing protein [Bacilli bacterium]
METFVLELIFKNDVGKTIRLSLNDPTEPVDPAAVSAAMDQIIASNIFELNGGSLVSKEGARVINRGVQDVTLV